MRRLKIHTYIGHIGTVFLIGLALNSHGQNPTDYVDPFIGTGGHGHTFPGATLPFGMVQLSPDTRLEGWDGCSGYHYSDSIIYGFSHTHLSGTGVSDYGDILLMPTQGEIQFDNGYKEGVENGYASTFQKNSESAEPGYYEVKLDEHDIDVRLTATTRVGVHEYTFNNGGISNIILDLEHRDELLDASIEFTKKGHIIGNRISKSWASEQHLYFTIEFSKSWITSTRDTTGNKAAFGFNMEPGEKLLVKVAISPVDFTSTFANLKMETDHRDFEDLKEQAKKTWDEALGKIEVQDPESSKKTIFYTALYHSMIAPNTFSGYSGKYRGMDGKVHKAEHTVYTVFSLWDTFRATHPLFTIIEQDRTNQFINTFLHQYQDGGELPIWELAGNYTGCMIGYHAIPVIADAYLKGIRGYDAELALEAMIHSASQKKLGLSAYESQGFIGVGDEAESVSKTLEYAYDDWCISQMAPSLGRDSIHDAFILRGQYFKNLFNPELGFMQPKMNGGWAAGFDPAEVNFNFTEANSWQYSMFAPQDISGLIDLHGGESQFELKLDQLFETEMELSGRHQADITGLIGQYAHGNEPSHHMAYLYNYVGKAYKTQQRVHQILTEQYTAEPDGLSGNEDCGQMSSWYVLSSLGFYSVTPGQDFYAIGTPHFESATINLENGNAFTVVAENLSASNFYIQNATLNGTPFDQSYLKHADIMAGGTLVFKMGPEPSKTWAQKNSPSSSIESSFQIVPVPYFESEAQTFTDSMSVEIVSIEPENKIYYTQNGQGPWEYTGPITLTEDATFSAYASNGTHQSHAVSDVRFKKIVGGRSIKLLSEYSNQYSAGGDDGLIDYLEGTENFRTGYWQGYYGTDFTAVVDLGKNTSISYISLGALQDIKSWIWYPKSVTISYSDDGVTFSKSNEIPNPFPSDEYGAFNRKFDIVHIKPIDTRYVKIEAVGFGKCPDWHLGSGNDTWMFLDEIRIK
jgi:predicted alpha-1,2-mannosidase